MTYIIFIRSKFHVNFYDLNIIFTILSADAKCYKEKAILTFFDWNYFMAILIFIIFKQVFYSLFLDENVHSVKILDYALLTNIIYL